MAYEQEREWTEVDAARGLTPGRVHLWCTRYALEAVPSSEAECAEWCQARFAEKEQRIAQFRAACASGAQPASTTSDMTGWCTHTHTHNSSDSASAICSTLICVVVCVFVCVLGCGGEQSTTGQWSHFGLSSVSSLCLICGVAHGCAGMRCWFLWACLCTPSTLAVWIDWCCSGLGLSLRPQARPQTLLAANAPTNPYALGLSSPS